MRKNMSDGISNVAKVAGMNVAILSLILNYRGKAKKLIFFACSLGYSFTKSVLQS